MRSKFRIYGIHINAVCDIAFLLFIFVMAMTVLRVQAPESFEKADGECAQKSDVGVVFYIADDGRVFSDSELDDNAILDFAKRSDTVSLCADKGCKYKYIDRVQRLLESSGITSLTYSVEKIEKKY